MGDLAIELRGFHDDQLWDFQVLYLLKVNQKRPGLGNLIAEYFTGNWVFTWNSALSEYDLYLHIFMRWYP